MEPIFNVRDLVLRKGDDPLTFDTYDGLTLLITEREVGSTTLCMTLAGRFSQKSGDVHVGDASKPRQRFKKVALAGTTLLDSLERQVDTREVIREQVAWAQPFFKFVPKDILSHDLVKPWLEPLRLTDLDPSLDVGDLTVQDRFRLRVLLALVARKNAVAIVVDDIDQIRSAELRQELLDDLLTLSRHLPVVVSTVNEDPGNHADHVIDLRSGNPSEPELETEQTEHTEHTDQTEEASA